MITEKLGVDYKFSSTQINFPRSFAKEVIQWGEDNVSPHSVYTEPGDDSYGMENDIHVTVLYGLHEIEPIMTKKVISKFEPFNISLGKMSLFEQDDYDVLKIEVLGKKLHSLHYTLEKYVENSNTFPEYNPHCTIGYTLPGYAKKYIGNTEFEGRKFVVNSILFSSVDGHKERIKL